jgi:hypothetical protein
LRVAKDQAAGSENLGGERQSKQHHRGQGEEQEPGARGHSKKSKVDLSTERGNAGHRPGTALRGWDGSVFRDARFGAAC